MKENNLKGVWTKFLAVLIAVAMVIPLAFSGWASNRVYAEDTSGNTGTGGNASVPVTQIPLSHEFDSGLKLDNMISTSNFKSNGENQFGKTQSVWVTDNTGGALLVDYAPGSVENGQGNQYESVGNFKTLVTKQIWDSAKANTGGTINSVGVALGANDNSVVKERINAAKAAAQAEKDQAQRDTNRDKVQEYLDGREDVPAAIKDTLLNVLGGKLRVLKKDTWNGDGHNWLVKDVNGEVYAIQDQYPATLFKVTLAYPDTDFYNMVDGSHTINKGGFTGLNGMNTQLDNATDTEKVDTSNFATEEYTQPACAAIQAVYEYAEEVTKGAVVHIVWPEIGTYNGRKVGMKAEISNIDYELDRRAINAIRDGNYNYIMTPAFQIAGLPQFGIQMHNVNSADFDLKIFYIEDEEGNPISGTDELLKNEEVEDVYFTYSSLSTYNTGDANQFINVDNDGNKIAPGEAGASYARSGLAVNEMVKPLSDIEAAYVTTKTNVVKGSLPADAKAESITGQGLVYKYDCKENKYYLTPRTEGEGDNAPKDEGYYYAWGWSKSHGANKYEGVEDTVGHDDFTLHATTLQYSNVNDVRFRMNSTTNESWFTIYPQGMTYNKPDDPIKSMSTKTQKNVYDNDQTSAPEGQLLPGDEVEIVIAQKVNELNADALIKYDAFEIADVVPSNLEVTDYYLKTTGLTFQGGTVTGWKTHPNETKKVLVKKGDPANVATITETKQEDGSTEIRAALNKKLVNPSRYGEDSSKMSYNGETYYLVILAKVKEDVAAGTEISNTGTANTGDNRDQHRESNTAKVKVVDKDAMQTKLEVKDRTKPLTFEVTKTIPTDATSFTITDFIDDCLVIDGEPQVYWIDENGNKQVVNPTSYQGGELAEGEQKPALVKIETLATSDVEADPANLPYHSAQAVRLTIENGEKKADKILSNEDQLAGKTLHLQIRTKIKPNLTDEELLAEHGDNAGTIPNTAKVKVNDRPEDSNKIEIELVNALRIQKDTTDYNTEEEFEFTINLKDNNDKALIEDGSDRIFTYNVYEYEGVKENKVFEEDQEFKSGDVIKIKGNQWAIINDLPVGTKYEIKEKPAKGYTNTGAFGEEVRDEDGSIVYGVISAEGEIDVVTGAISQAGAARTRFVNSPTDSPVKKVTDNDQTMVDRALLEKDREEFTYTITQKLGKDATKVVFADDLEPVLELAGENGDVKVEIIKRELVDKNGKKEGEEGFDSKTAELKPIVKADGTYEIESALTELDDYTVEVGTWETEANEDEGTEAASGTKLTVNIKDKTSGTSVAAEKMIQFTFKAMIKADADLSKYVDAVENKVQVPNKATVSIDDNAKITNEVIVVPPTPTPEKKVGKTDAADAQKKYGTRADEIANDDVTDENELKTLELAGRDEEFVYTITQTIPVSATKVVFTDELVHVLEVTKTGEDYNVELSYVDENGATKVIPQDEGHRISVAAGRNVTATIDDATDLRGKKVTLTIKAKIQDHVTDTQIKNDFPQYEGSGEIPNKGGVQFDNNPKMDTNTVTVTPPPAPEKFINGIQDADTTTAAVDSVLLNARNEEFTYTVTQVIPKDAVNVVFEDTLEDVLEITDTEFSVAGVEPVVQGQKVTATIADATDLEGQTVTLTIKAKIRDGVTDTELMAKYSQTTDIPNEAKVIIDGHGQTTNEVLVTPPPVPEKHINNETHAVLKNKDEVFTYTVDFFVPVSATVADFTDTLNDVLVPANVVINTDESGKETSETITEGEITATVKGGSLDTTKPFNGKTLAFTLEGEELNAVKGQKVTVTFKAIFDPAKVANLETMTKDQIAAALNYEEVPDDNGVSTNIVPPHTGTPNDAKFRINPDNEYETSNKVTVTPPSDEPGELDVTKELKPEDAEKGLTDEEKAVQFGFEVTFKDKTGAEVDASTLVHEGSAETLAIKIVDAEGNEVTDPDPEVQIGEKITFKLRHGDTAKITGVPGQYPYAIVETATAGYEVDTKFNDEGIISSGVTTVAPFVNKSTYVEPGELDILKTVAGMENIPVQYRDTEFVFEVDLEGVNLADLTDEELAALDVKVDGEDLKNIVINEDETFVYETGVVKDGKIIAVLKSGETAKITGIPADTRANTRYVVEEQDVAAFENTSSTNASGNVTSGNTTTAVFINEFHQPSVDPVKKVNGKDHDDLSAKDQVFTYTVTQFVPAGAESFHFEDTINGQIEYASDATVTIDKAGTGIIKTVAKPSGKELTFDLTKEELAKVVGHVVTVTFDAKYVDGIDDETLEGTYVGVKTETQGEGDEAKSVDVETETDDPDAAHIGTPNRATTKVGNHEASTNIVTTTAPPEIPTPEKSIGNDADDQAEITRDAEGNVSNTPKLNLKGREDVFTYSVTQQLPANLKSVAFEDTLKDVLTFNGSDAGAKLVAEITNEDGSKQTKDVEADVNISGQKITVTPKSLDGLAGAKLTVYFEAVIKPGITDDQLIAAGYTNNEIPNEATVVVNGSPLGTNEVFVKPPSEEESPEKKIIADSEIAADPEAEPHKGTSTLKTRPEEFTYVVSQKVPVGAYYLEFSDTIEEVLEFVGGSETASLTVDGADVEGAEIEYTSDRTIVAKVGTPTAPAEGEESPINNLEGKTVVLTFKARLKADVDDDDLYGKYVEESLSVPNEATVTVNDNPLNTNKVYVTPPPETPEDPEKFVEGEKYGTPADQLKEGETPKESYNLAKRISEVTYTVIQKVPVNAVNVQFIDNLERVLEVAKDEEGNNKVAVKDESGNAISEAIVRVVGNTIIANIDNEDVLKELTNKKVILEIVAKVRNDVTDEQLIEEYGEEREIPNTATVIIGNNSGTTNEVKITPPEEPEEPVKNVNADGEGTTNAEQTFATLAARDETFTYTIKQLVPENADTVTFHDTLEPVLEVISATINGAADYGDVKITPETNEDEPDVEYTSVEFSTEDATNDRGKEVTMTIVAKIKADVTDEDLVERYGTTVVPNYAVVTIDDEPKVTDTVNVTPPPIESEKPVKKVEGKDEHDLVQEDEETVEEAREKEFEYTITQKVPVGAVRVDFEDTLASVLELYGGEFGGAKITADETGAEIAADFATEEVEVKEREQTSNTIKLTAAVTDKTVLAQLADKTITMSFKAKIRTGVLDSELIEKFGSTRIPNKATVKINGNGKSTDEVYVTPPETPGDSPEKKVEGRKHGTPAEDLKEGETEEPAYEIANRMDEFTYTVSQKLPPEGFTKVVFSDKVEPVLEIVKNSGSVTGADGFVIEYSEDGRTITATKEDASADANAEVTLTFKAKLRAGITDKRLIEDYGEAMEIPNFATVSLDDQPKVTNEVKVTPPPVNREDPTKDVEGIDQDGNVIPATGETEDTVKLTNRKDEFVYTISQEIPAGAVNVVFDDTLERVLHVVGTPEVTVDGTKVDSAAVSVRNNGRIVSATVADATAYADRTMVLTIHAAINEGVTDAQLIALYGDAREIPNEATVTIDGDGKGTNEVKVTPPEEPKDPEKFINDQKDLVTLPAADITADMSDEEKAAAIELARTKTFTYKVVQVIPENAKTVTVTDAVEKELAIVDGSAKVTVTNEAGEEQTVTAKPNVNGNNVTFTLEGIQEARLGKGTITLEFAAKINASDAELLARPSTQFENVYEKDYNGTTVVPNKATVKFDFEDEPRATNTVEVTPPPTPGDEPEKKVNDKDVEKLQAAEGQKIAEARAQKFTYTVSQKVPAGCVRLEFTDTLEDVLEFNDKSATAGATLKTEAGEDVAADIKVDGQKITALVTDADALAALADTKVILTFDANIKADVTDAALIDKYGTTAIPNNAKVAINGNPVTSNEVKVIPPETPGEKPEKTVNGEKHGTPDYELSEGETPVETLSLAERMTPFTYEVSQKLTAEGGAEVTKVAFEDKLESVLEVVDGAAGVKVFAGETDVTDMFDVTAELTGGRVVVAAVSKESADFADLEGQTLTLKFDAKLKAGVTDAQLIAAYGDDKEIPNVANVTINDSKKATNEVKVTPPPVNREDPTKDVEGIDQDGNVIPATGETEDTVKLTNRKDEFVYTVSQVIPAGAVNVKFTDILKDVLEVVGTPEVTVDGKKVESAVVDVIDNKAVSAEVIDATEYADNTMVLTIRAKIKEGTTDETLIALYGDKREIPNTATVTIDGDGKGTNEVKVTPPEEPEDPEKLINDQKDIVTLGSREEEFTYTVKQIIPENAKTVTITDTIENELVFVDGSETFTVDGKAVEGVTPKKAGNTISVELKDVQGRALGLKEAVLTFKAAIDPEVTDQQLLDRPNDDNYEKNYNDTTVIPNKAEVKFDFEDAPRTTNTVEVTPPPVPSDEPEKKVNGEDSIKLEQAEGQELAEARAQTFTYTVSQKVPAGCVKLEFEDTLEDVLEIVGTPKLSTGADATVDGQKVTAVVTDKEVLKEGTVVTLTIEAKIRDTVKDSELIAKYGTTTIPNKAKVFINGNPKSTNEVKVTPPDEPGDKPEKKVNGEEKVTLDNRTEEFTYTVTQKLPSEVKKVEFSDKVEGVLVIDADSAKIVGSENADAYVITVDGQTITAVAEDASADATKEITLEFKASLKPGTTDDQLISLYGEAREIPNHAIVTIDDTPRVSNEVTVTPPPSEHEDPKKEVTPDGEGIDVDGNHIEAKLTNRKESFTYTVSQLIPAGAVNVQFDDVLERVLEVVGEPTVTVDGKAVEGAVVNVRGGRIVNASVADATAYNDKTMVLTINAKIKEGVTDAQLVALYGAARQIPNEATVTIDNDGRGTNEVLVTPPEEPEDPKKEINGDVSLVTLGSRDEVFTYTVKQIVPENAKTVTITDTIENELVFVDNEGQVQKVADAEGNVSVNRSFNSANTGTFSDAAGEISVDGKTITVQIDDATALRGDEVVLTFKAAIDPEVTDAKLLSREGAYKGTTIVPNTAEVMFDFSDKPKSTNTVEVTPPPVPGEEPEKKVGMTADDQSTDVLELAAEDAEGKPIENPRAQTFTYTVSQKIPAGAVNVVFTDTLEDVLSFEGEPKLTLSDGTVIAEGPNADYFAVDGQTITATIADATDYADDTITLTFAAVINDGVTDAKLIEKYKSTQIPNKATIKINGNPHTTNEVRVTPPPTPGENPEKKVNGKDAETLANKYDSFTYTVSQKLNDDTTKAEFVDTVESVLEIDADSAVIEGSADASKYVINVEGSTIKAVAAEVPEADQGQTITLKFDAKIKTGITDAQLIAMYGVKDEQTGEMKAEIPNHATVSMNDNPKATNEVKVTPPPTVTEEPEKTVEADGDGETAADKKSAKLMNRAETFTYTVSQKIPEGAVNVQFDDILERVLEVVGTPVVTVEDETIAEGTVRNNRIVHAEVADATAYAGKNMTLTFTAKIRDGITDDQLIALFGDDRSIPNEATVTIDNEPKTTNEVLVTPPEEPEEPKKQINGDTARVELGARDEVFEYTVTQQIPENAKTAAITDRIEDELVFVDNAGQAQKITEGENVVANTVFKADNTGTATVDGKPVGTITINNKLISVDIEDASAIRGKEVVFTFKAAIDPSVTDAALLAREGDYTRTTVIPNVAFAEFDFAHDPLMTNTVEVTPPPTPSDEPEKKVGMTADDQSTDVLELAAEDENGNPIENPRAQTFTYTVSQKIPAGAVNVVFEDKLEEVLETSEDENAHFAYLTFADGSALPEDVKYSINTGGDGQTITAVIDDATALADETVTLTIFAKIRDEVTDKDLITKYKSTQIPNRATVKINGNGKSTNEVKVTPPPTPGESPEKKVNGQKETYELDSIRDTFEYTVTQKIPEDAETVVIEDTVENVLEIAGEDSMGTLTYADGTAIEDQKSYRIEYGETTQTIVATIDDATAVRGKELMLTFTAKIKSDVTREQLVTLYGEAMEIPNFATVTINDNPKVSNTVKVTPPPSTPEEPEKKINGGTDTVELTNRTDKFTYTVSQKIPDGAVNVVFKDTLKDALEITGYSFSVEGVTPVQSGQTVTATIEDASDLAGDTVTLTIEAKIRDSYTDAQLIELYGEAKEIPNTAEVTIDNKPQTTNEVKVTPPDEPGEEPVKKVNKVDDVTLANRTEEFTYTVSQKVPANAKTVTFTDKLEDVLEIVGEPSIDGAATYKITKTVEGQNEVVTATTADAAADRNKTVTLTFKAKVKADVTDAQLIAKYKTDAEPENKKIPNTATVTIDNKPETSNTVTVTPPPAEREEPEKTVDNAQSKTLANRSDTFTYRVSQKIPANATSAAFTDPIDDFLEVVSAQITGSEDASKYVVTKAQTVTAVAEDVTADRGRTVTLEIVAKIKSTVSDADIIAKYGSAKNIPNKANVEIDGEGMSTNEVIVTPPNTPGDEPEKKVNGVEHVDLANRNEVFEYTVTQKIPEGAEKVVISDTLERFLEATECTFSVEGIEPAVSGQTIAVTIDDASQAGLAGQTVVLTIKAKIRDTVTDAELIAEYATEAAPANKDVPNTAVVTIDGKDTPTNTVTVTPPDEEPGPKGSVIVRHITTDGKVLKDWEDVQRDAEPGTEYTTSVDTFDGYTFVKLDEGSAAADGVVVADKTLEVVYVYAPNGSVRVKHVTTDGTVLKDWEFVQENQPGGTAYETTVGTFEGYEFFKMDDNSAGRTGVVINGKTLDVIYIYNKENEPPSPEPGSVIVRYITDKGEILEDWTDVVRDGEPGTAYTTEQKGFEGYTFLEVPAYSDDVTGTVEANTTKQVTYVYTQNGSVIVRHIAEDGTVLADWEDVVRNVSPGTGYTTAVGEFEGYTFKVVPSYSAATEGSVEAGKTLEVTYVYEKTPSAPEPPITKKVNGLDHYDLKRVFEPYTYTVTTNIPKDAVNFVVTDKLEPVIEFVSAAEEVSVRVNGQIIGGAAAIAGQTLTVTIPEDVVKTNPDAEVVIEFSARLREGANINAYMETTESPALIPNTAEYSYTDTQDIAHGKPSNEVTVTPPTRDPLPEPPVIPELKKFVNDDPEHADLTIRNEIFKYTLNTKISKNAVSFVITDTLVDELEFAGENGDVKVTIGGTDVTGELAKCEISGQTLTIELAYDHLVQREGQEVVVTFNAKIRDDVSEDVLIEKYGEISGKDEHGNDVMLPHIPNEASITLNNDGGEHAIKSNIVTVTPPSREIKKLGLSVSKRILGGNDELAGAKLAIYYREADGSYVEIAIPAWTSGTEAHLVELTDGEYVLVETEAPEGYEISGPIHFRISGNGSVLEVLENGNWVAPKELNTIIMYDAKKQTPPTPTPTPTPGEGEEKKDTPVTPTPPTTPPGTPTTNPPGTPVTTRRVVTPSTSTATRATSTGDANSTTLWIVLAAIASAAAAGAAVMVRRRRREDD